ncbi:MAG: enoyl-CoA hydratase/isomerase family protein [Candidatus Obscuribacterales bacterium]|nr:enoyl-CoA hydratase/isomerase family protein [Candidatus Obscuribacterales bacterium]
MSPSSFINHHVQNRIGYIIFNRPESKNAITTDMWRSIPDLLDMFTRNDCEVVVLKGAGGVFAAGADLLELEALQTFEEAEENWNAICNALMSVGECSVPTVAAIDGPCIGGGCLLAIACDLRYATETSVFGVPVAKLGIVLDDGTVARLVSLVGAGTAREMLLRGNLLNAPAAQRAGLVNGVVPDLASLDSLLSKITEDLLDNSALSVEASRSSINRVCGLNSFPSVEDPANIIESYLTEDFKKRIAKALGKSSEEK